MVRRGLRKALSIGTDPRQLFGDYMLPDWLKYPRQQQLRAQDYTPIQLSASDIDTLTTAATQYDGQFQRVRPHKAEDGLKYASELIADFHSNDASYSVLGRALNIVEEPKKYVFEIYLKDGTVSFRWGLPDQVSRREFRQQMNGLYPNSAIKPVRERYPDLDTNTYLAGCKLEKVWEKYRPIRTFSSDEPLNSDPYRSILSQIMGSETERVMVQFVFTPVGDDWTEGELLHERSAERTYRGLNYGRVTGNSLKVKLQEPSQKRKRAADRILEAEGSQAFYVNARVFVFGSRKQKVTNHIKSVANAYTSIYTNKPIRQGLVALPYHNKSLVELARRGAAREYHYDRFALRVKELAAISHLPSEDITQPNIDWARKGIGSRPPSEARRTDAPPDMRVDRDLSNLDESASAMAELSRNANEEAAAESSTSTSLLSTVTAPVRALSRLTGSGDSDDGTDDIDQQTDVITIETKEKQEAFDSVYRDFITGKKTRAQMESQYNENVVDNLIRKFEERRAEELGVDLEELDKSGDVFSLPGARRSPPEATDNEDTNPESADTTQSHTQRGSDSAAADSSDRTTQPDGEETGGLPVRNDDQEPVPVDDDGALQPTDRGQNNPAHVSQYAFDQQSSSVQLRREPGLQRYFPFELESIASGDATADEGDIFAGFDVRDRLIHSHADDPDQPIWLGYDTNPMDGLREIGLEKFSWFRHMTIFGTTGKGKSTALNIIHNQIARKGYGFVFIDPKGDTVDDLVRQLPEDRLEDVIWIEPGSETYNQVAGINFLEPGDCATETEFDQEVESIIDDLRAVLRGGDYWGPKMEGITSNIARAMIRSRRKFTLVDMYYVLVSQESRARFANIVSQEGMGYIHEYTSKIAEMEDEDVDPVLRRIQDWIEDPISRSVVAHRKGTINISEAVEEGKIILVRNTIGSEEIRKVVATGVMRRVWSTIRKRDKQDDETYDPYFAILDEFDDIASDNMALDKMLSKARSGKMGVITCLQNPSQLKRRAEETLDQMFSNSDTMFSFGVRGPDDAKVITPRFTDDDITHEELINLPAYTALTTVSVTGEEGPKSSGVLAPDTFAPYPPRRTREEAEEIIAANLDEYGVSPLEQDLSESETALVKLAGDGSLSKSFLEALWAEQIRQDAITTLPPEYETLDEPNAVSLPPVDDEDDTPAEGVNAVTVEELSEGFRRRTSTAFENLPDGILVDADYVEVHSQPNQSSSQRRATTDSDEIRIGHPDTSLTITDKGIRSIVEAQTSDWRSDTEKHNEVLRRAFIFLSATGMEVSIIRQEHDESLPDAIAYPPIDTEVSTRKASRLLEEFNREYPTAAKLSNGGIIAIEAETSTYRKPARTLENLARSVRDDNRTLFITPEDDYTDRTDPAMRVHNILNDPSYIRAYMQILPNEDADDADSNSEYEFYYNKTDHLNLGTPDDAQRKHPVIKKGQQAVWVRTDKQNITLYDAVANGSKMGSLRVTEAFGSTNAFQIWCRYDEYNNEWVVYDEEGGDPDRYRTLDDLRDDWQLVYEPFVPEREFETIPGTNEWEILETPLPKFLYTAKGGKTQSNTANEEANPPYDNIDEVPSEASIEYHSGEENVEVDPPISRAGFTREAVPIPDRIIHDEMPDTEVSVNAGPTEAGSSDVPDNASELVISDTHLTRYESLNSLVKNTTPENFTFGTAEGSTDEDGERTDSPDNKEQPSDNDTTEKQDHTNSELEVTQAGSFDSNATEDTTNNVTVEPESTELTVTDIMLDVTDAITNLNDDYFTNSDELGSDPKPEDVEFDPDAIEGAFSRYNPTVSKFWDNVWDEVNLNDAEPVYQDDLPGALRFGINFRESRAIDAVRVGMAAGHLIPFGDDALRRPGPRDNPGEYLSAEEKETFQRRATWKDIWDTIENSPTEHENTVTLVTAVKMIQGIDEKTAKAAIGAGVDVGVLHEQGDQLALGERRLPEFWNTILEKAGREPDEAISKPLFTMAIADAHGLADDVVEATLIRGKQDNVLYHPTDGTDLYVNSPRVEGGPEIADVAFTADRYPASPAGGEDDTDDDGDTGGGDSESNETNTSTTTTSPSEKPTSTGNVSSSSSTKREDTSPSQTPNTTEPVDTSKTDTALHRTEGADTLITEQTAPALLAGGVGTAIADRLSDPLQETLRTELAEPFSSQLTTPLTHAVTDAHTDAVTTALSDALTEPLTDTLTHALTDADPDAITQAYTDAHTDALTLALSAGLSDTYTGADPEELTAALSDALSDAYTEADPEELTTALSAALSDADPDTLAAALPPALTAPLAEALAEALAESLATPLTTELSLALPQAVTEALATTLPTALTAPLADALAEPLATELRLQLSDEITTEHIDDDIERVTTAVATAATAHVIGLVFSHQIHEHQSQVHDALPGAVTDTLATPSVKDVITTVAQQTSPDTHAQLKDDLWNAMFEAGPLVSPPLQQLSERAATIVDAGGVQATTVENDADASQSTEKVQSTLAGQNATDDGTQATHGDASTEGETAASNEPTTAPNTTIAEADPSGLRLSPTPDLDAVQACLEAAATFFHGQVDTVIDASTEFNVNTAPTAGYRLPETPRAYFCGPEESPARRTVTPDDDAETGTTLGEAIDVDGDTDAETATTLSEMETPYRYLGTDTRGWPTEIVEEKQLGWAPPDQTALYEYLSEQGFAKETMVATGLFSSIGDDGTHPAYGENEDGEAYMDFTTVDDADMEPLRCFFIGRYVFPYTDAEGRTAFFIGRVPGYDTDVGNHPDDFAKGKYVKLASRKPYTIIDEPIYGRETVVEGAPLVVTEGIADAITAHAHGIPCISPVTTEFKTKHQTVVAEIVQENAISTVYFLQDSDPISASVPDRETVDEQVLTRSLAVRELFLTGSFPGSDACTPEAIVTAATNDDDEEALAELLDDEGLMVAPPADPDADATGETRIQPSEVPVRLIAAQYDVEAPAEVMATSEAGPLGTAMDIQQHGPGIKGAVKTSMLLDQTTPPRSETLTGVTDAAAALYEDRVINADEDTPALPTDTDERRAILQEELTTVATNSDGDEDESEDGANPTEVKPAAPRGTLTPATVDSDASYSGTDVWLIEMPQLAAVKRDLDDYLQEGWLGLLPPMEWTIQTTLETDGTPASDGETPAWVAGLADAEATPDTYPARFRPDQVQYPAVNDLANTVGTIPRDESETPPAIYQPRRTDEPATSQWPGETAGELRAQNQALAPMPEVNSIYPPLALFGLLPRIHPRNHPAATAARQETRVSTGTDLEVDPDEIESRLEEGTDYRELTGRYNPLWNADLRDLGLTPGSRGKNPLGHYGDSENYFVVFDDELAYCHKRKALYNFVHFALCDAGVRDPNTSVEGQSLSEKEYFKLWEYAYEKGVVPEETPVPIAGLKWYAITNDFISAEDYAAHNDDDVEEGSSNSGLPLPATIYRRVLKDIERQTGLEPPQLADLREQERGGSQQWESTETEIDLEHLYDTYGMYVDTEDAPDFLKQFTNRFIKQTTEEVTTNKNETIFEPRGDIRDAYNTLVKAIRQYDDKYDDTYPDSLEMTTYSSSQFTKEIKKRLSVEIEKARPSIGDRGQTRVWFGIEFTDEGEKLHDIVTQVED